MTGDATVGTDTLRSVEAVRAPTSLDTFDATGFTASSTNAGSASVNDDGAAFNEFEGLGGDDTIIGNGNTRVSYRFALAGVTVDIQVRDWTWNRPRGSRRRRRRYLHGRQFDCRVELC